MDLSIIPEVIGESIDGALRAGAAIGVDLNRGRNEALMKNFAPKYWEKVTGKADEFHQQDTAGKLSDVVDLATMVPVVGYGGAAVKGAIYGKKLAKAKKALKVSEKPFKQKLKASQAKVKYETQLTKAARKSYNKKGGMRDQRIREMRQLGQQDSMRGVEYAYGPSVEYETAIKNLRRTGKKIKKGARIARKKRQASQIEKIRDLSRKARRAATPSRSAIAGMVYQMSKKKTKR